jgi:hypothetical protein
LVAFFCSEQKSCGDQKQCNKYSYLFYPHAVKVTIGTNMIFCGLLFITNTHNN